MIVARCDFETRSDINIKTRGAGPYFASKHFRPLMLAYRLDDCAIRMWLWPDPCPDDLREAIESGCQISAFNAGFERQCFDWLADNCGWPRPKIEQYVCTAAAAAAMGLPRDLEGVADVLRTDARKNKRGKALIQLFSVPRKPRKDEDPNGGPYWNTPEEFPDDWADFQAYCMADVMAEAAVADRLIPLSSAEQAVYTLDQKINQRGLRIDVESAQAAITLADRAKASLDAEMNEITDGAVTACSQVARLTDWVVSRGVALDTVRRAELEELLEFDDLPEDVRKALELRLEAAKTSVSKLKSMLTRVSPDGRLRGAFLYHAAGTGRWSSVGAQLHNMPRPRKLFEKAHLDPAPLFQAIRTGDPEWLRYLYGPKIGRPLHLLADAVRGFIWAAPGHELVVADYSGIEGAVAAWLAKEEWKVKALFEIIADPSLPDLYRRAAAFIMNTTTDVITKDHPLRQSVGKVSELALQYGGGIGAFVSMAKSHSVKLRPLYEPVWAAADEERRELAVKRYERCLKRGEAKANVLPREAWLACELIKIGWRARHIAISGAWGLLEEAARDAISAPGQRFDALSGAYIVRHGFLWRLLPSGRCLAYASPKLTEQIWCRVNGSDEAETLTPDEISTLHKTGNTVEERGHARPRISVAGVDSQTKKFSRYGLYGGLLFENDVQALARDLLVTGMFEAESAGYPVIGHVHDEILAEVSRGFGDVKEFERLICALPPWAAGLPLTASGWRGKRYRKA